MYAGKTGSFPVLKGKGAEIRGLSKPLLDACEHFLNDGNQQDRQIKLCLRMVVAMEGVLDDHREDYRLPQVQYNPKASSLACVKTIAESKSWNSHVAKCCSNKLSEKTQPKDNCS